MIGGAGATILISDWPGGAVPPVRLLPVHLRDVLLAVRGDDRRGQIQHHHQ